MYALLALSDDEESEESDDNVYDLLALSDEEPNIVQEEGNVPNAKDSHKYEEQASSYRGSSSGKNS